MTSVKRYNFLALLLLLLVLQVNSISSDCILKSKKFVGNGQTPTLSDYETLTSDIEDPANFRLNIIKGCYDNLGRMTSLQLILRSETGDSQSLVPIGQRGTQDICTSLQLEQDEKVRRLVITHNSTHIEGGSVLTYKGNEMKWGNDTRAIQQWFFSSYELIGLYGTSAELGISNIGVFVFNAFECSNTLDD